MINKLENNFPEWESLATNAGDKVLERLIINLKPIAIINNILYVDYIGSEDKKSVFQEYFNNKRTSLEAYISTTYPIIKILSGKNMETQKISWLKELFMEYNPKGVEFSIHKPE